MVLTHLGSQVAQTRVSKNRNLAGRFSKSFRSESGDRCMGYHMRPVLEAIRVMGRVLTPPGTTAHVSGEIRR